LDSSIQRDYCYSRIHEFKIAAVAVVAAAAVDDSDHSD